MQDKYGLKSLAIGESNEIYFKPYQNIKEIMKQNLLRYRKQHGIFINIKYNGNSATVTRVEKKDYKKQIRDKYGFKILEIGESIFHEVPEYELIEKIGIARNMQSYYKRTLGKTFSVNQLKNGIKITRRS